MHVVIVKYAVFIQQGLSTHKQTGVGIEVSESFCYEMSAEH